MIEQPKTPSAEEVVASFMKFFNQAIRTLTADFQHSFALTQTAEEWGISVEEVINILKATGNYDDGSMPTNGEEINPNWREEYSEEWIEAILYYLKSNGIGLLDIQSEQGSRFDDLETQIYESLKSRFKDLNVRFITKILENLIREAEEQYDASNPQIHIVDPKNRFRILN